MLDSFTEFSHTGYSKNLWKLLQGNLLSCLTFLFLFMLMALWLSFKETLLLNPRPLNQRMIRWHPGWSEYLVLLATVICSWMGVAQCGSCGILRMFASTGKGTLLSGINSYGNNVGQSSQWPSLPPHEDNTFKNEATTEKIQTKRWRHYPHIACTYQSKHTWSNCSNRTGNTYHPPNWDLLEKLNKIFKIFNLKTSKS